MFHPVSHHKWQRNKVITPYLDTSYKVLEIPTDSNEQPLAQTTYQLDSAKNGLAVSNFLNTYKT